LVYYRSSWPLTYAFAILTYYVFFLMILLVKCFILLTSSSLASRLLWSSYWSLYVSRSYPSSFPWSNLSCWSRMIVFYDLSFNRSFNDLFFFEISFFSMSALENRYFKSIIYCFMSWKWLESEPFLIDMSGSCCSILVNILS
jgi:hypothetical protein